MRFGRHAVAGSALWFGTFLLTGVAQADGTGSASAEREQASALFTRGEALYRIGDYARAAELFDQANTLAPHPDIAWNAARSFDKAGSLDRAANAYAEFLATAGEDASGRAEAVRALERLGKKVGRIELHVPRGTQVVVDDKPVKSSSLHVIPGSHTVRTTLGERTEEQVVIAVAGRAQSVSALTAVPPPAPPAPELPPPPEHAPSGANPVSRGVSPWLFVASASTSALVTGVAIAFGLDTRAARERFDEAPSEARFEEGRDKQLRTNVAIGVAAGLWTLTAVGGLWLVDWRSNRATVALRASPSFAGLDGRF